MCICTRKAYQSSLGLLLCCLESKHAHTLTLALSFPSPTPPSHALQAKERMEADKVAQEEQEVAQQEQMEKDRKEYRKMLNKVTFRRDMPIFP